MRLTFTIAVWIAISACSACNKKKYADTTQPQGEQGSATATIVNQIQDSVYITLSGSDISTGTQPHIIERVLPPSDTLVIPRADLKNAYRYQYDWHTKDYRHSSWMQADANGVPLSHVFDYYGDGQGYILTVSGQPRDEMLICLDGDGLATTWQAIDACNASGLSVWSALTERERTHSFVISRFHTVKHSFIDTSNTARTTNLAFMMDMSLPRIWLKVQQKADSYVLSNNLSPYLNKATSAKDTLYYSRYTIDTAGAHYLEPYYLLVRKSVER